MNRPHHNDRPLLFRSLSLRTQVRRSFATLGMLLIGLLIQAQAPPPPPAASSATISRSLYFEAAIVVVMFGLALFVVCRSSRRN